jgi:hypothetical protein
MRALIAAAEAATRPAPPAPPWSWHDAARATWRVYEHVVAQASEPRTAGRGLRRRSTRPVEQALSEQALSGSQ